MTTYHVLDLFCGLGGFSAAFEDSDRWDVTTVDIEDRFDPDVTADVFDLRPSDIDTEFDVVLASVPCTVFSPAGNHDLWDHDEQEPIAEKSRDHVALAHHTVGLMHGLSPDYWFLENPTGRLRWVLGPPTGQVTYCQYGRDYQKRTDLWGDHPPMQYDSCRSGERCHKRNVDHDGTSAVASMDNDVAERSKVPYDLSETIRDACERALDGEAVTCTELGDW
jgi:hypothetical protein